MKNSYFSIFIGGYLYKNFFFLLLFSFTLSCQTTPKISLAEMPAEIGKLFAPCSGEGDVEASLFENNHFILRNTLGFYSHADHLEIEILGLFDESLQSISIKGSQLHQEGKLSEKLKQLQVNSKGFITWDDHLVAVKASEISCLLQFRLPIEWRDDHLRLYQDAQDVHMYRKDQFREIHGVFSKSSYCVDISWYGMWIFFKRHLEWCVNRVEKNALTLRGINGYHIGLKQLDSDN